MFFAQYPTFDYVRGAASTQEFYRMCDTFDWNRENPERQQAHDDFKIALVQQFNILYGTEVEDIHAWRGLCLALEIFPLPENVDASKEVCSQSRSYTFRYRVKASCSPSSNLMSRRCFDVCLSTLSIWSTLVAQDNPWFNLPLWKNFKRTPSTRESTFPETLHMLVEC